ncbi:hypothetical protein [Embleya scabrispora]|uniref:hypothetical protein n=1 Tax=Embleya scabrispora TaxID=159449 RepID=UPI001374A6A7|nr:hypothetical protein [Embleya scabrispora]
MRVAELSAAGALPDRRPTRDTQTQARGWLGKYFIEERSALVSELTQADGHSRDGVAPRIDFRGRIERAIVRGQLTASVNETVRETLSLDDTRFRARVARDAARHHERDDALCHPLLLNRWTRELNGMRTHVAERIGTSPKRIARVDAARVRDLAASAGSRRS